MRVSIINCLRRIIDSPYHCFKVIPKPDNWQKREKLRRFVAWQYATRRSTVRMGYNALNKIFHSWNIQRMDKLKLEKHYARERLDSALAEHHFDYPNFRNMLNKAHILLDNIVLSQLAIYEPRSFKSLVMLTKQMAHEDGKKVINDIEQKYVETDPSLFDTPFPYTKQFLRRRGTNYKDPPKKLKESEY